MTQILIRDQNGEQSVQLSKRIFTVGTGSNHDAQVSGEKSKLIFTVVQRGQDQFELLPSDQKLRLNGKSQSDVCALRACDRVEWNGGAAVFWPADSSSAKEQTSVGALKSLQVLQAFAANLSSKTALSFALSRILDHLIEVSGAETAYLLSESPTEGGWVLSAARHADDLPSRRELFSNTVLLEALKRREAVCVESLVGHPWSQAHSVIASRVFSVACLPLIVDERIFGAMYLMTQTPGRSLRRERLAELNLLITQAALMMATQTELNRAQRENASLRRLVTDGASPVELGTSQSMQELARLTKKLAGVPLNVLVLGETGTGKEVISRAIHTQGTRAKGPFVAVNCAAIPETLLESTLFGHERGAFTGAVRAQPGKFQQAHGGTLLLDEIGELPLELQAKLLRVLQEKTVEPVGGREPKAVDVRVLAATHQNLEQAVREGKFRQDLYFRLNGAIVKIPPLRDRREDITPLARHFLKRVDSPIELSEAALKTLEQHSWPGNVRELEQVITRAALLTEGDVIQPEDLQLGAPLTISPENEIFWQNLKEAQAHFTREYVNRVLARNGQNRAATAAELGISERSLYRILAGTDNAGSEA